MYTTLLFKLIEQIVAGFGVTTVLQPCDNKCNEHVGNTDSKDQVAVCRVSDAGQKLNEDVGDHRDAGNNTDGQGTAIEATIGGYGMGDCPRIAIKQMVHAQFAVDPDCGDKIDNRPQRYQHAEQ